MNNGDALADRLFAGRRPCIVSFIGAGGKTSLLKALAMSARSRGISVLTTTTARVRISEFSSPPFAPVRLGEATTSGLKGLCRKGKIPFIHNGTEGEKFLGIPTGKVMLVGKGFGAVLVEADGGKGMPLKRLRDHEPPLPTEGKVVLVVGADAVGRPLEDVCFNWQCAVAQGIVRRGQVLDAPAIRRILYDQRGYLDVVGNRPMYIVVNKSDIGGGAEYLARGLYAPNVRGVFTTVVKKGGADVKMGDVSPVLLTNRGKRIAAVVLAAGESRRFGMLKQNAPMGNSTVLGNVLKNILAARGLQNVVVVLGHGHDEVRRTLGKKFQDSRLCTIINEDHLSGMSTSIRAGVRIAGRCDAVAIFLGDQPFIDPSTIESVLEAYLSRPCRLAYPVAGGRRGHPVVLGRELFSELASIEGDVGARDVVDRNAAWAAEVPVAPNTQLDIDHQKDLKPLGHRRPR